jgi:hypothetical protein
VGAQPPRPAVRASATLRRKRAAARRAKPLPSRIHGSIMPAREHRRRHGRQAADARARRGSKTLEPGSNPEPGSASVRAPGASGRTNRSEPGSSLNQVRAFSRKRQGVRNSGTWFKPRTRFRGTSVRCAPRHPGAGGGSNWCQTPVAPRMGQRSRITPERVAQFAQS